MQFSNMLPQPEEWPSQQTRASIAPFILVVIFAVCSLAVGLGFAAIGRSGALKYALLLAVLFLLIAAYNFITRIRPKRREKDISLTTHVGSVATEVRYSFAQFASIVAIVACMAVIFTFAAVDFFLAGDQVPASSAAAALCAIASAFFLSFILMTLAGRLRRGRILLSERGIHQEGRAFESFLPWDSFVGMKASYNGLMAEILVVASANAQWNRKQLGSFWKIDKLPPVPMIEIDTTVVSVDRTLLYHLIRFYLENPDARSELGTDASIQRAQAGSVL